MKSRVFTDTSNFLDIDRGDEILVDGKRYRVTGHERERRFGMEEPKFWVKKAVDTETGEKKILKLAFFETFEITLGSVKIHCFRSPDKEGEVLDLVKDHAHFMHGTAHLDAQGNNIRVLDIVNGGNFYRFMQSLEMEHKDYFHEVLPSVLKKLVRLFEGIRFLHANNLRHGDIRNDHVIIEEETGNYVWIDFDYDYDGKENPFGLDVFGTGNILLNAVGKGFHDMHMISTMRDVYGDLAGRLETNDFCILNKWRLTNLKKLYPYVPRMLNDMLMHFSQGSDIYYESVDEVIEDLNRCVYNYFE